MSGRSRWRQFDAEHWVHVLLVLQTSLLVPLAALGWLVVGSPVASLLFGALAALSGWLTSAWRRELPWSWWVLTTLTGAGALLGLVDLVTAGPSWPVVLRLAFAALFLLLLCHPGSRARTDSRSAVEAGSRSGLVR
jgi:hypothetical protein